jgi:RHS repeat-associated protein
MDLVAEVPVTLDGQGVVTAAQLQKSYVWRLGGIGRAHRLLQMADHVTGKVALAGYDGRGNLTSWTDGASGALLGGRDYSPWGDVWLEQWNDQSAKNSFGGAGFGFSTEYRDETGLVYYGFRYYSPDLGRFLSRDPLGEAASGVNLYAFARNDPVNFRELYGLCGSSGEAGSSARSSASDMDDTVTLAPFVVTADKITEIEIEIDLPDFVPPEWNIDPTGFLVANATAIAEAQKRPCAEVALKLLSRNPQVDHKGSKNEKQFTRFNEALHDLVKRGGDLGVALVLGWASAVSRTLEWTPTGPAAGSLSDGGVILRLSPTGSLFGVNSSSSGAPRNPAIVIGHELGHGLIPIDRRMAPSGYLVHTSPNSFLDIGIEAATVHLIENPLRNALDETERDSYSAGDAGEFNISALISDPQISGYIADQQRKVTAFVDNMKQKHGCY